jgi:hypothetical protein
MAPGPASLMIHASSAPHRTGVSISFRPALHCYSTLSYSSFELQDCLVIPCHIQALKSWA